MTKWTSPWKPDHPIYQRISNETKTFLVENHQDILDWLWDSYRLINQFKADTSMSDYSFLVSPAYKALEKWLISIAPFLGVPENLIRDAVEYGKFSPFLNDEKSSEFLESVFIELEIESSKRKELRTYVQSLNSTLKTFRHNPAHCGTKIEDAPKTEVDFMALIHIIDNLTKAFIDNDIIPNRGHKLSEEEQKKLREISAQRKKLAQI
ncbi:MAG: hypothetical protein WC735_01780 [Candidatus Paceibacterota bacterium]|jgi:hypothetical protein